MSFSRDFKGIIDVDSTELMCQERISDGENTILLNIFSAIVVDEAAAMQEFGENEDEDGNIGIDRLYFAQSGKAYMPGLSPDEARAGFIEFGNWG